MAKKAELEETYERYRRACLGVARAEADRALSDAVLEAAAALHLVHPAVTYQRRFLKADFPVTPTLDCLLRYAPPLFMYRALDVADAWYAGGTRTERGALPELPAKLAAARARLAEATELWSALAARPGVTLSLDGRGPAAAETVAVWLAVGAVVERRHPDRTEYARTSDPRRPARGKCGACGHVLAVPLLRLLDSFPCPTCRRLTHFVVVGRLD